MLMALMLSQIMQLILSRRNKDQPFFIYYPMLLVHDPFVPTPDSPEWNSLETRSEKNDRFLLIWWPIWIR